MRLPSLLRKLPVRIGLLAVLAGSALAVVVPTATALAAPDGCANDLKCVIAFGDARIAERLSALTILGNKVTNQLNAGHITTTQADYLQGDATTNKNGLTSLKTTLDGETDVTAARNDVKNIYLQFRIYGVVLPRDYRVLWTDLLTTADQKLRALQPKIESAIAGAPASEQAQLNTLYSDYKAQLQEAESQIDAAQGQVGTLTVSNFNNDHTVFQTALNDMKTDIQTANRDIHQAANDLNQIVHILKSNSGGTSTATPAPTATSAA